MRRMWMLGLAVCLLLGCAPGTPGTIRERPADGPVMTVKNFLAALKAGKVDEAVGMLAEFPEMPAARSRDRLERIGKMLADGTWGNEVVEGGVKGDQAVVIINENLKRGKPAFDLDPAYLVWQKGRWRILPGLSRFDRAQFKFGAERLAAFRKLEEWFKARKQTITAAWGGSKGSK